MEVSNKPGGVPQMKPTMTWGWLYNKMPLGWSEPTKQTNSVFTVFFEVLICFHHSNILNPRFSRCFFTGFHRFSRCFLSVLAHVKRCVLRVALRPSTRTAGACCTTRPRREVGHAWRWRGGRIDGEFMGLNNEKPQLLTGAKHRDEGMIHNN